MELEPGPFTTPVPFEPPPPFAVPSRFVQLLVPYAALFETAGGAIDRLHAAMVSAPSFDEWQASTPVIDAAITELTTIAAIDDTAALAPVLETLAAIRADLSDQAA